jgi:hypothetical protein
MSAQTSVVVPRGHFQFPDLCPVCLSGNPSSLQSISSDSGKFSGFYVFFTTRKHLIMQIPICTACAEKEKRIQGYGRKLTLLGLVVGVGVAIGLDLGRGATWLLGVAFCAPGIFLSELVGKPVRIGRYDDDIVQFSFKSSEYAEHFRSLNRGH